MNRHIVSGFVLAGLLILAGCGESAEESTDIIYEDGYISNLKDVHNADISSDAQDIKDTYYAEDVELIDSISESDAVESTDTINCSCEGKACGEDDGCGGKCVGTCPDGKVCNPETFTCEGSCTPDCFNRYCGEDDGCGGKCTKCYNADEVCNQETFICESCNPDCNGKHCGDDDGCGGRCTGCENQGEICNQTKWVCESCKPDCNGKYCGEDDGCGGKCTSCQNTDETCNQTSWVCESGCTDGQTRCKGSVVQTCRDNHWINGADNEENALGCKLWYYDFDGDGFGTDAAKCLCHSSGMYQALKGGDCNDLDDKVNPSATEMCNNIDDNCNGQTDEDFPLKGEECDGEDSDLCKEGVYVCKSDGSGVECNDTTGDNIEVCNGKDDDCNGMTDEGEGLAGCQNYYLDADGDGWGVADHKCLCAPSGVYRATNAGDCDDSNAQINPAASEVCNGKDDNCNGMTDEGEGLAGCQNYYLDADSDGWGVADHKCLCAPSGLYRANKAGDCRDDNPQIYPEAPERCDGVDNDCDGQTDEDFPLKGFACDGPDGDLCKEGIFVCKADGTGLECTDMTSTNVELCNNIDDDCDGLTDEDFPLKGQPCNGPNGPGIWVCSADGFSLECR